MCVLGACPLPMSELKKFKFLCLVLFFMVSGCLPQGRLGPGPNTEIVVLDHELTTQQTVSECNVKSNRYALNNKVNDSEIFKGFQKQENFGECMNTKGYVWGHQ